MKQEAEWQQKLGRVAREQQVPGQITFTFANQILTCSYHQKDPNGEFCFVVSLAVLIFLLHCFKIKYDYNQKQLVFQVI